MTTLGVIRTYAHEVFKNNFKITFPQNGMQGFWIVSLEGKKIPLRVKINFVLETQAKKFPILKISSEFLNFAAMGDQLIDFFSIFC